MKALLRLPAFAAVALIDIAERLLASSGGLYKVLLMPGYERTRWNLGIWRAWRGFYLAHRSVPAYRDYIAKRGGMPDLHLTRALFPDLSAIPEMDKASYVKAYPIHQRIKGGRLPREGVMVDESSGSSGVPTSWVRGPVERQIVSQMMRLSYHESIDAERPIFILNAFALGAWATGMNVSLSLTPCSIVKSTGPNLDKIVATMLEFGPGYRYVVMGYPPFLKGLADDTRIDWGTFVVDAGYGGEGISESLRTYLGKKFKRVVGSYGASDLEVNMAIETDLSIALRRAIGDDKGLRDALIHTEYGVTPMIFQYNPMAYFVETNSAGELVVTMSRPYHLAPKIRYNIHDRGHVMRFPELKRILRQVGREDLLGGHAMDTDLPLLLLYGRSDMSIDYYGANVTPDSIREIVYAVERLAPVVNTFRLLSYEDAASNKRMEIAIELIEGAAAPDGADELEGELYERLAAINGDFLNAWKHTAPGDNMPRVSFHPFDTGPFEGGQRKLKNVYVETDITYDKLN